MIQKFDLLHASISLKALFESMPVAMVLLDRDGRHVAANHAVTAFNDLPPQELIGKKSSRFQQGKRRKHRA